MDFSYAPNQAQSYFNSGTGKFRQLPANKSLAPEWDGETSNIPPGFGVIRIENGREQFETEEVSVSVNGYSVVIPRGSARIVSAIHINRLMECRTTEYTQTQFYKPPEGFVRPRFPITVIVEPKNMPVLVDNETATEVKAESKEVRGPRKTKNTLTVGENELDAG
jgi:hypothetical protein